MKKIFLSALTMFSIISGSAQWLQQNANFINDTLGFYEISIPDRNTAWAVCYDGKIGLLSGRPVLSFTRTTNGGVNWNPGRMGNDQTLRFSNISAIDGQEAWVAMHKIGPVPGNYAVGAGGSFEKGGGIFHTTDAGVNWQQTNPTELFDANSVPRFVHFKDRNHGITMGDPNAGYFEIYTTNNRGKKWKRVSSANIPAALPGERGWISGHSVIGDTIWFGTSAGRMYKSKDFGKTWTVHVVDPNTGTYIHEIAFLDDGQTGVAHGRNGNFTFVFSTRDGGQTWTNYFQPANWKNSRMTAVPGTNAFVSTSVHGNPIYRGSAVSYDAGQTWTEIDNTANKAACRFLDAETGYAGGFFVTGPPLRGGIFKSQIVFQTNAPALKSSSTQTSNGFTPTGSDERVNVYPSPAKNLINVELDEAMMKSTSAISLLTINGKVVESKNSKSARLIQMNVANLPAGMYVLRVQSNGETIHKTVSIVK